MSRIIELPQDAAEIFVANPKVANAVVRSPRKLYIVGMDTGQTSVVALDQQGRQIAALEVSIRHNIGQRCQHRAIQAKQTLSTGQLELDTPITGGVDGR